MMTIFILFIITHHYCEPFAVWFTIIYYIIHNYILAYKFDSIITFLTSYSFFSHSLKVNEKKKTTVLTYKTLATPSINAN